MALCVLVHLTSDAVAEVLAGSRDEVVVVGGGGWRWGMVPFAYISRPLTVNGCS